MIGAIVALDSAGEETLHPLVTVGQHLSNGRDCLRRTANDDFEIRESRGLHFFELAPVSEAICLLVRDIFNSSVYYPRAKKEKPADLLHLKEVPIPDYSIFVGHEYVQHGKSGRWGSRSLP